MLASELGQASLAVALVGLPMASRMPSQAPAFDAGVLDNLRAADHDLHAFSLLSRTSVLIGLSIP